MKKLQKIQKVAGGIQRLTSRRSIMPTKPSPSQLKQSSISFQTLNVWMKVHVNLIKELSRLRCQQFQLMHEHVQKYCMEEWKNIESELLRERGLWGPENESRLDKWMLDNTEGNQIKGNQIKPLRELARFFQLLIQFPIG